MQEQKNVIDCYNKTAKEYAKKFLDELNYKHFDRILLAAFAAENAENGKLIDLGCGPGQTTKFLSSCGVKDILGIDISQNMIAIAKSKNPQISFETADILNLPYADNSFSSAVAFYAIVHFDYEQIKTAFEEIKRIVTGDGQFLFSFHIGDNIVHLDNFLDQEVNIDFNFFDTKKITTILAETGFEIIDAIERQHYPGFEYASKRAYIWAKNTNK